MIQLYPSPTILGLIDGSFLFVAAQGPIGLPGLPGADGVRGPPGTLIMLPVSELICGMAVVALWSWGGEQGQSYNEAAMVSPLLQSNVIFRSAWQLKVESEFCSREHRLHFVPWCCQESQRTEESFA